MDRVRIGPHRPVEVAQIAKGLADLGRGRVGPGRLVEGHGPGDRRGRHGRARHVGVAGPRDRRIDALAGGHDVDVRAVIAEVGERVVLVVTAPREAAVATEPARPAIRIGQGRDRDDLVVARRDVVTRVVAVVGGRRDHRDPTGHDPADGLVQRVVVGQTAVAVVGAGLGDAHVHGFEEGPRGIDRVALGEDPVESADVPRDQAVPVVVEDLDPVDPGARGHADDTEAVVLGGDRAGHVRPVVVPVAPRRVIRGRAVVAADHVQVRGGRRPRCRRSRRRRRRASRCRGWLDDHRRRG